MAENRARNWTQQPQQSQTQQQTQQQQSVRPEEDVFLLGVDQILAKLNSRIFEEKAANFSSCSGSGGGHNSNSFSSPTSGPSSNPNSSINNNISNGSPTISSTSTSGKSPSRAVPAPAVVTRDLTPYPSPPDSPLPSSYFSPPKSSKKTSLSSLAASFVPNFGESPTTTTTNAQLHVALANVAAAAAAFQHQQQQFQQHQQQQSLQQQQQKQLQQQQQSNICSSSSSSNHHQSSSSSGASNGPIQQSFGHITGLQHFNRMVAPSALAAVAAASSFLPLPPLPPPPPPGLASLWATFASPRAHQSSQSSYISSSMSHAKVAADAAVAATINSEHNSLFEAQCLQEVATTGSGGSAAENSLSSSGVSSTTSPSSSNSGSPNNSSSSLLSIAEQQQQQQSSTSQSVGVTAVDSSSSPPSSSSTVTNKNCSPSAHFSPNAADQSFNPFGPAIFDFSRLGMTGGLNALLSSGSSSSEALAGGGGGSGPRSRSHSVLVHPHHPLSFAAVANGGHHSMAISSPIISSSSGPGSGSGSPSNAVVAFTKEEKDLELKAKSHREAASRLNECDKIYSITRFDNKPPRDAQYSTKVFIGGVPWDMNNDDMMEVFEPFGATSIQRPGKDVRLSRSSQGLDKAGYLYLIFESEPHVHSLLKYCKLEMTDGGHRYFYMLYSKRSKKEKRVQVIPWNTADSVCMVNPAAKEDQARTVFLGALHGMMNSKAVVDALTRIFGPVEFVSLDTDKYKYPMGSGRAMFTRHSDYLKAVNAGFVRVKSDRFEKTIQIDQFLDDKDCCRCGAGKAPVFCKACQKYYCKVCWTCLHADESAKNHPILMKSRFNSKI